MNKIESGSSYESKLKKKVYVYMLRAIIFLIFLRWFFKFFAQFIILDLPVATSISTVLIDSIC